MLPVTRGQPFAVNSLVYSGRGAWFGYSIKNAHATDTSLITFYDGIATTGVPIGFVDVPAGRTEVSFPSGAAVRTESGLFIGFAGGTPTIVPYYLTETRLLDGLALFDDGDHNLDSVGLLKFITWLDDHGLSLAGFGDQ